MCWEAIMKKIALSSLFIGSMSLTPTVLAAWPVSVIADVPGQMNQMVNHAQMLKDYSALVQQLEEMRRQYEQMQRDYKSVTGSRNLGNILNNPLFRDYVPDNWQDVQSNIRNNGYNGLNGTARALRDMSKIFDACQYITGLQEKRNCEAKAVQPAQDRAFATDAYQTSVQRVSQIESLMREINATSDPKSIAELNARIQAEQALIQNEQTKLTLYQAAASAEKELLEQQTHEIDKKTWSSRQYGTPISSFRIGG